MCSLHRLLHLSLVDLCNLYLLHNFILLNVGGGHPPPFHSILFLKGDYFMDVILRNDPSLMDFQSYNEFTSDDVYDSEIFVEGVIGDKVKNIINRIAEFIKTIISRIRGYFAEARIKQYKRLVDDPNARERLQQHKVAKWDTEANQKFYTAGYDIMDFVMKCFGNVVSEQSTRNVDKDLKTLEAKKSEIKTLVENSKNTDRFANEQWSEYEALNALIDESTSAARVAFVMESFYNLIKSHKKGKLDSLYGVEGVSKEKVLELFIITNEILRIYSTGGVSINEGYGIVAHSAGSYRGNKAYNTFSKNTREAIKKHGGDPNNVLMVKVKSVKQEYYTDDLDELDAYIEYAMNDLHDAMELRNRLIQESDDDTVEDFEESDTTDETPDDVEECGDGCKPTTEYYSDAIVRNYNDEPIQENKTYCLKSNDMFTESYDEPTGPDRFVQEYNPDTKAAVLGGILGFAAHDTLLIAGITTDVMLIVKAVDSIIASVTYKKKYGRFAADMKAVMDVLKESKDGTIKTGLLNKALHTLRDDCNTISGKGIISHKAMVNLTATERSEIKQLSTIIKDLERMLTSKPDKAAERRIPARIEDFVKKCETVTKLLNRGKNPGDVVKEYMS